MPLPPQCFRALCCKGPPPARPEYDLVCIGLTGSGKTSLLSRLCSESPEHVVSTTGGLEAGETSVMAERVEVEVAAEQDPAGRCQPSVAPPQPVSAGVQSASPACSSSVPGFSIKAVPFQNAVLNVKELGGADHIRKYWSRYYQGSQGVVFVLDSASSEGDLETARNELHSALQHPQLCTLPFLILASHQDKPAARSAQEVRPGDRRALSVCCLGLALGLASRSSTLTAKVPVPGCAAVPPQPDVGLLHAGPCWQAAPR
ncbi:hypothetical protein QTO34_014109 [Cnephaeus nilssonii]|uniref:ADP-ribosylation factor-like protein 15 n=1 Tax=Cnephaeus nilssonii TaxID=3371016 RepID=A0AA40I995_CNENI|nr:hypothetical protein QTO34_014109 [Eptesicus nilssonii]